MIKVLRLTMTIWIGRYIYVSQTTEIIEIMEIAGMSILNISFRRYINASGEVHLPHDRNREAIECKASLGSIGNYSG